MPAETEASGKEYVMAKCQSILLGGLFDHGYSVSGYNRPGDADLVIGDARFRRISRKQANQIIITGKPLP